MQTAARLLVLAIALGCARALAQSIALDTFDATGATGAVLGDTSWAGSVTRNPGSITVAGTAKDDNGWGAVDRAIDATAMKFIVINAQRDAGNTAPVLAIQFEDRNLNTQIFSISTASFAIGTLTAVQIPIAGWSQGFDPAHITGWSIGGGGLGLVDFRMTLENLALSATAAPGVATAPTLSGQFGARTIAAGGAVTFTVTATGTAPLNYQWRKDSVALTGATAASLVLASVVPTDAGTYVCAVTNAAGTTISEPFVLNVTAQTATIALGNLTATYSGRPITPTATTSPAGLVVTFTYDGGTAVPVNAGTYPVRATIVNPTYAGTATGNLIIVKAPQSITFGALPSTITAGVAFAVGATASSGGAVSLAVAGGNATLSEAGVIARDSSPVRLRATQAGDENYLSATAELVFTTTKRNQSIQFAAIADQATDPAPIALTASASSELPVSFSIVRGPATVTGNIVTVSGGGTVVVRASQVGNDAFNAAPEVDRSFNIAGPPAPTVPVAPVAPTTPVTPVTPVTPTTPVTPPPVAVAQPRLLNLSTRTRAGGGDQVAIAGFVISGEEPKPVLVRAIGPALAGFGVTGVVAAPKLELFRASTLVASNTGWATGASAAAVAAAAERVGAFALSANSADSALLATLSPGNYTAVVSAADGRSGVGLIEVYDLGAAGAPQRMANLSVRAVSGADADTLIVGLVVEGVSSKRMLIRAVGPGLAAFGVAGALTRTQLAVFSGANEIARNAGWSSATDARAITTATIEVGAFALAEGSGDSALVLNLAPGAYTAQVSGMAGASGITLVEVYDLP